MSTGHLLPLLVALASTVSPPLVHQPLETVTPNIDREVTSVLAEERVPGLALVLVRNGSIVWTNGYGVANRLTRDPVTNRTVFPAASLGKPIAAFAAMRLQQAGRIDLDLPVSDILSPAWTSDPAGPRVIVRHLLTHTAGLSNFLGDRVRRIEFEPGSEFSYSGVGFMVLQDVLQTVGGATLDAVVDSLVLGPLDMRSTWFATAKDPAPRAYGHQTLGKIVLPFLILFTPILLLLLIAAITVRRALFRKWHVGRWTASVVIVAATVGASSFLASRAAVRQAAVFFTVTGLVAAALLFAVAFLLYRSTPVSNRAVRLAVALTGAILVAALSARVMLPLPDIVPSTGNAASSLRTSAQDVGRFLQELSHPRLLADSTAIEFSRPAVQLSEGVSWALGIGHQIDSNGRAFFHWGANPSARSFFLIYPDQGIGIAILANGDLSRQGVARIVQAAVGGGASWQSY